MLLNREPVQHLWKLMYPRLIALQIVQQQPIRIKCLPLLTNQISRQRMAVSSLQDLFVPTSVSWLRCS
ncbi:hypothetical protein DPMN_147777 [Dreissena polymorpha]|uniref:Uncharacterized protein n=1 Tax=Dreissena polymorpha TaxID=45954 RepID=A0A9D4FCT6_DREPO|nr:hypothetical protein DPMN_147777 [Dreissena polymorpha]